MEVVDTETAKEFMKETLTVVDVDELLAICADVEEKSRWFRETLATDALPELAQADFDAVVKRIFSTRGKPRAVIAAFDIADIRSSLSALLDGEELPGPRLQAFLGHFPDLPENVRVDFASELLHFARPEKHWLWTRWMWDPRTKTP